MNHESTLFFVRYRSETAINRPLNKRFKGLYTKEELNPPREVTREEINRVSTTLASTDGRPTGGGKLQNLFRDFLAGCADGEFTAKEFYSYTIGKCETTLHSVISFVTKIQRKRWAGSRGGSTVWRLEK